MAENASSIDFGHNRKIICKIVYLLYICCEQELNLPGIEQIQIIFIQTLIKVN